MKLVNVIKKELIKFEVMGNTFYMPQLTLKEVKKLESELGKLKDTPEDLTPLMYLFTDIVVDENGERFEEVDDGCTFEDLEEILTINFMLDLSDAVVANLKGTQGN